MVTLKMAAMFQTFGTRINVAVYSSTLTVIHSNRTFKGHDISNDKEKERESYSLGSAPKMKA